MFDSIESTVDELSRLSYIADTGLATSIFLALRMERPLFLEGEPGVGKTEVAKVLSRAFETTLIRSWRKRCRPPLSRTDRPPML